MSTCGVCGKDMLEPGGHASTVGIRIEVNCDPAVASPAMVNHMRDQLGPYWLNHQYEACWECWLRSLGFKPPEPPPTPEPSEGELSGRGPF